MKNMALISAGVVIVLGLVTILALGGAFGGPLKAQAAGEANPLAASRTVTNLADAGAGTLRQALLDAQPGDVINFSQDGVIALASPLPTIITNNLTIDASNRNVVISGSNTPTGTCGLAITSSQVTVRGLQIVQFDKSEPPFTSSCGIGIFGSQAMSNTIAGNYIGTDKNSSTGIGNSEGIVIISGPRWNTIGGTGASDRNIVSGNSSVGVGMYVMGTMYNQVIGNYIGTNVAGTAALPNQRGVMMWMADENTIGAIPATQSNMAARQMAAGGNLISGNSNNALSVHRSMSNTVAGNWFGLNAAGTAVLSGGPGGHIGVGENSQYNVIRNNVIVGNETSCPPCINGIAIGADNAMYNQIMYNRIGIGPNDQPMPNWDGLRLDVWPGYSVGPQKNTIGPGNIIAFNADNGVSMSGTLVLSNTITQNSIYSNTNQGIYQEFGANLEPTLVPTITLTGAANCEVQGTACPDCVVEIFSDYAEEGRWYEGTVTADASGDFSYSLAFRGPRVTATATDPAGNTSEFSNVEEGACRRVLGPVIVNSSVISP